MNHKYIAAIEIGSSRIKGLVAAAESDGRIKILAVEDADSGDAVRYGRVKNAREVSTIVNDIIRRLENNPHVAPGRISAIFIADGGRSLYSSPSEATINFGGEEEITRHTLERLNKEARFNLATDRDVLAIAPKRFFVDQAEVKKIVGTYGSVVRGEFTVITQAPENHRALDRIVIESHGTDVQRDYVTRLLAQTEMALSDSDRQVGCLFVDFGAETTSLAAFRDEALLFAATIPVGGANITRDLSSALSVTVEKAKNIKHTKGVAVFDRNKYEAPDSETKEIINYVSARAGEIIANVNNMLEIAGLKTSDFPGGIVITGGAMRLKGFPEMVESIIRIKPRPAVPDSSVDTTMVNIDPTEFFDVISITRYAAAHSDIDCLSFPDDSGSTHDTVQATTPKSQEHRQQETTRNRRPEIPYDDPSLLDDDKELVQPDNINNDDRDELPTPDDDPRITREKLRDKIKRLFGPPVDFNANDMD